MKLSLSKEERDKVLLDILCNGAVGYLASSGVEMEYSDEDYKKHREKGDCYEDVLMKIINSGGKLEFVDTEGDESKTLTAQSLETARLQPFTIGKTAKTIAVKMVYQKHKSQIGTLAVMMTA